MISTRIGRIDLSIVYAYKSQKDQFIREGFTAEFTTSLTGRREISLSLRASLWQQFTINS